MAAALLIRHNLYESLSGIETNNPPVETSFNRRHNLYESLSGIETPNKDSVAYACNVTTYTNVKGVKN